MYLAIRLHTRGSQQLHNPQIVLGQGSLPWSNQRAATGANLGRASKQAVNTNSRVEEGTMAGDRQTISMIACDAVASLATLITQPM